MKIRSGTNFTAVNEILIKPQSLENVDSCEFVHFRDAATEDNAQLRVKKATTTVFDQEDLVSKELDTEICSDGCNGFQTYAHGLQKL